MLSYKIMKLHEFGDAVFYRVACGCGSKDHDFELWLEYDKEINDITMMISKKLYWKHHYEYWPWYEKMWKRLFAGIKLIFGGYLEMETDIILMKKEHIEGFIEALQEGYNKDRKKGSKMKRCTKENPSDGRPYEWYHPDAKCIHSHDGWSEGSSYDEFKCPHCGITFKEYVSK